MRIRRLHIVFLLFVTSLLYSCEPEIDTYQPDAGEADFSVYVALGNSLTAGFADGELYKLGQMLSYPNIIAKQMIHAGAGEFKQPLMKDELGFGKKLVLGYSTDCLGNENMGPVSAGGSPDPANFANIFDEEGPFHNFGVPGTQTAHLLIPGYGLVNNYYGRFSSSVTARIIDDALNLDPTFFSLWIGSNDILGYALSGGGSGSITSLQQFRLSYETIISELIQKTGKGVIANIPDIMSIPFFNTIPPNGLILTNQSQIDSLNNLYEAYPDITFNIGPNNFIVADPGESNGGFRQLNDNELVLLTLPLDRVKCEGWGSVYPIPSNFYLSEEQINEIRQATVGYNDVIRDIAEENNLAFVDIYSLLQESITGITYDGINFNTGYITGGVFSLDGVHLSPRGNAIIANYFIDAINVKYESSIPKVSPAQYPGIIFP